MGINTSLDIVCSRCSGPVDPARSSVAYLNDHLDDPLCTDCFLTHAGTWGQIGAGAAKCPVGDCPRFMNATAKRCGVCRSARSRAATTCGCGKPKARRAAQCSQCSWATRHQTRSANTTCPDCGRRKDPRAELCWDCRYSGGTDPIPAAVEVILEAEHLPMELSATTLKELRKLKATIDLAAMKNIPDPFADQPDPDETEPDFF